MQTLLILDSMCMQSDGRVSDELEITLTEADVAYPTYYYPGIALEGLRKMRCRGSPLGQPLRSRLVAITQSVHLSSIEAN